MEMEEKVIRVISDGRRLDIQLSEASGLSRSRVASLMEEGCCAAGGDVYRKAGTKVTEAGKSSCGFLLRRKRFRSRKIYRWTSCMRMRIWQW